MKGNQQLTKRKLEDLRIPGTVCKEPIQSVHSSYLVKGFLANYHIAKV